MIEMSADDDLTQLLSYTLEIALLFMVRTFQCYCDNKNLVTMCYFCC